MAVKNTTIETFLSLLVKVNKGNSLKANYHGNFLSRRYICSIILSYMTKLQISNFFRYLYITNYVKIASVGWKQLRCIQTTCSNARRFSGQDSEH